MLRSPIAGAIAFASCIFGCSIPAFAHEPGEEDAPTPLRTAPALIEKVQAVYPPLAREKGIGATVSLSLTVGIDGSVSDVKVVRGAGLGFDEAAVEAARRFRFKPATENGKPIASTVLFDQNFVVRPHLTSETAAEPIATEPPPVVALPAETPAYRSIITGLGPRSAASSTTVRNLDFDLRPKTSPNDILRVVPGLLAVQHQGGGKADQLFLRGFDADHGTDVAVFIDGVPINLPSHAHGQGFADLHFLIPEAIERIDVEKGPYDVRYGDFATAGAVNLVTRKQFDESSAQLTLESYPTISGRGAAGARFLGVAAHDMLGGKLHPWAAFEASQTDGPFTNAERLRRYNLLAKVSYDISPQTSLGLLFEAYGSGWIGSGQIPSREVDAGRLERFDAIDPSEGGLTERQMAVGFVHHKDPSHEFDASIYFVRYKLALWNDFTFFLGDPEKGDEIEQDDDRTLAGGNLSYHFHHHWRSLSLRTTMGAQVRFDGVHLDLWDATSQDGNFRKRIGRHTDPGRFHFGNNNDVGVLNLSGYAEEDVVWRRLIRGIVGLRADYFGFNVDDKSEMLGAGNPATSGARQIARISPKATLVITPWRPLDVYLNFGMGFHSNDARIAVQQDHTTAEGSVVNTVPRFYGGEVGARLSLWERVSVAAAFWMSYLENETVFSGDGGVFEPSDPTRRLGFDLEARAQILKWLYLDFDLAQATSTAVTDKGNGGAIALAPRLYMTGGLTAKHSFGAPGAIRGGLRFRYLADRPAFDEDSDEYKALNATDPRRVNAEGWFILDAYVSYRWRFLEASISAQNLLNSKWREAQFGNNSCTRDEVANPSNPRFAVCGATLPAAQRTGVPDVHFTPGVPFNLQTSLKAYF